MWPLNPPPCCVIRLGGSYGKQSQLGSKETLLKKGNDRERRVTDDLAPEADVGC